ncbi:MAG: PorV/PorQ family protein [Ignavibacteria bacterium]|jgi:hypothetical protein|nr:PorV/PorQ family protein [Ignavibacteria bacterium]
MRPLSIVIFLIFSTNIFSQSSQYTSKYDGTLAELYLYRQPSAKAEAMGRGMVANNNADFGSYYNPALTSLGKGINFNSSYSTPYYLATESKFNYLGISYSDEKLGSFGLSRYYWTLGEEIVYTTETGQEILTVDPDLNYSLYTLNYSREIVKDFFAGINLGLVHLHFPQPITLANEIATPKDAFTADIGVIKRFNLESSAYKKVNQSIQLAGSVVNFTGSKITYNNNDGTSLLPIILRLGGSYNVKFKGGSIFPNSNLYESLTHIEYQNVTNSDYNKAFMIGEEFIFSDIFILRAGFFTQTVGLETQYNEGSQSQFTYGAGIKLPLNYIFNMKNTLSLGIDYVNMEPPTFSKSYKSWDHFNTINLNLKFIPSF